MWEWTSRTSPAAAPTPPPLGHDPHPGRPGCMRTRRGPAVPPGRAKAVRPPKVIKGGSHLCAPNYCLRYRRAARQPQPVDTSTCHLGFRCVIRPES